MYKTPEYETEGLTEAMLVYGLGLVLFFMVRGELPFYDPPADPEEAVLDLEGKHWADVSEGTKELLKKLLSFESRDRPTLKDLKAQFSTHERRTAVAS